MGKSWAESVRFPAFYFGILLVALPAVNYILTFLHIDWRGLYVFTIPLGVLGVILIGKTSAEPVTLHPIFYLGLSLIALPAANYILGLFNGEWGWFLLITIPIGILGIIFAYIGVFSLSSDSMKDPTVK